MSPAQITPASDLHRPRKKDAIVPIFAHCNDAAAWVKVNTSMAFVRRIMTGQPPAQYTHVGVFGCLRSTIAPRRLSPP
jgi:hypothetical protein